MYEVLCTCTTAPLEGLLVDKAKYSENVGHHLVRWIFKRNRYIRTNQGIMKKEKKESNEDKRHPRDSSADPTNTK